MVGSSSRLIARRRDSHCRLGQGLSVLLLTAFLVGLLVLPRPASAEESPLPKAGGPDWMLLVTPAFGYLNNTAHFSFKVPQKNGYQEQSASLTDGGWGGGLLMSGMYRWITATNVLFAFPEVNSSRVIGDMFFLSASIPTGILVEPYLGLGAMAVWTNKHAGDMHVTDEDELFGEPMIAHADIRSMAIDNQVVGFFPKLGVKVRVPIQHWYLAPWYSFLYEEVKTRARSEGGHVNVYKTDEGEMGTPQVSADIPPFDTHSDKTYKSHLVGMNFRFDFNYFLQVHGSLYYNLNHDLFTLRTVTSVLFSPWVGLAAYLEYTQKITVTNTYFLVGPTFFFTPKPFKDRIRRKLNL